MTVILSLAAYSSGCLLPAPGSQLPQYDNRPPRIETATLSPPPTFGPVRMSSLCPWLLSTSISDPDEDPVYWRIFIDYDRGTSDQPQRHTPEIHGPLLLNPTTLSAPIEFRPQMDMFGAANPHTVELFIGDRPFSDEQGELGTEGRLLIGEEGLTDSYVWSVIIDDTRPCGAEG